MPGGRGDDVPERGMSECVLDEASFCAFAEALPQPLWTASPAGDLSYTNGGLRELMARLIEDLLDVARITQGRIELRREPLDLRDVIMRAVETAAPLLEQRQQALRVLLPPEPLRVDGDAARLEQVLTNLLNNAAHYSPVGSDVLIEATREDDHARLLVRDTGRGIPPERLEQIFEPFAQLEPTPHRRNGGLGLGLSLVRRLVVMHGGRVEATSGGAGRGSEFVVRLPQIGAPAGTLGGEHADGAKEQAPRGEHHRVLVVDDNLAAAQALGTLLESLGHDVLVKYSGGEAIEAAKAFAPDVALLDVDLPMIDGYELARRLRQGLAGAPLAMIAISGPGQVVDRRMAAEAGFERLLVKPVDLSLLQDLLTSLGAVTRPERALPKLD